MRGGERTWSIAAIIFVVQFAVVAAVVVLIALVNTTTSERDAERAATDRTMDVAEVMVRSNRVIDGLGAGSPDALTRYLGEVVAATRVDWISVYSTDGDRVAANRGDAPPTPEGQILDAVAGGQQSQTFTGKSGAAVRTVVPILDGERIVGAIDVAVDLDTIQGPLSARLMVVWLIGLAALLVVGGGAAAVSIYLRRVTRGRGAEELSRMFQFYDSGLRAIADGVVLLNTRGEVVLMNHAARSMLGVPDGADISTPLSLSALGVPDDLVALIDASPSQSAAPLLTSDLVLLVDSEPVTDPHRGGRRIGTILTLRDHTRLLELTGDVDSTRTLADALAAQTHEFANRLHTMLALMELDRIDEAIALASAEVETSQSLAERMFDHADDSLLTALLLGKSAQAHERGIRFDFTVDGETPSGVPLRDLVTIIGNLIDNALDAAGATADPAVVVHVESTDGTLSIAVSDSGAGPDPALVDGIFELGASTKGQALRRRGIGLALVRQSVRALGGRIDVTGSTFRVMIPLQVPTPEATV